MMVNDDTSEVRGGGDKSLLQPVLAQLFTQYEKPIFKGHVEDWPNFQKSWEEYHDFIASLHPSGVLPESLRLQLLKASLDENSKKELRRKMEENPHITYTQFWAELQNEFEGDVNYRHRNAWERVQLDQRAPLTSTKWRKFCAEFELLKQRVEDRTDQEEYRLIFRQLPEDWRLQVAREESRRRRNQFWVRITNLMGNTPQDLKSTLEGILSVVLGQVKISTAGYLVECGNEKNRQKILELDGDEFNDRPIHVAKSDKKMEGPEIMTFVAERLKDHEDLLGMEESLGIKTHEKKIDSPANPPPMKWRPRSVQTVSEAPAPAWTPPEQVHAYTQPSENFWHTPAPPAVPASNPMDDWGAGSYQLWVQEVQQKGKGKAEGGAWTSVGEAKGGGKGHSKGGGKGKGKDEGKGTGRGKGTGEPWGPKPWGEPKTVGPPSQPPPVAADPRPSTPLLAPVPPKPEPNIPTRSVPPTPNANWGKGKGGRKGGPTPQGAWYV